MLLITKKLGFKFLVNPTLPKYYFCQNKMLNKQENEQKYFLLKQKADLALKIYEMILQKPANVDLNVNSLHKMIIQTIDKKRRDLEQLNLDIGADETVLEEKKNPKQNNVANKRKKYEDVVKPFIEMFDQGFEIKTKVFSQTRIKEARIQIDRKYKLVFHPTYLITSQVFNQLDKLGDRRLILTGHYGISKTFSVCLFWHLVKFIDQYRFHSEIKEVSEKMRRIPKLVYWTIEKNLPDPKPLIINQCQEIKQNLPQKNVALYDWKVSIKQFYSKYFPESSNFNIILVLDQINQIASIGRRHQEQIENIRKRVKRGQIINPIDILNQQVAQFLKAKKYIQFIIEQFNGFISLSSMNLEKLFFQQIQMSPNRNQIVLPINTIKYSHNFFQELSLLQIIDYFIFQMDQRIFRKLKGNKITEEDKKRIKDKCFDYVKKKLQNDEYFFFTPYDIRFEVTKRQKNIQLFRSKKTTLNDQVEKIFNVMVEDSTETYKKLLINHFQKNDTFDEKRIEFMHSVYRSLTQKINKEGDNLEEQQISQLQIKELSLNPQQISELIDQRLFQYYGGSSLQLMLPSQFLKQVLKLKILEKLNLYVKYLLKYHDQVNDITTLGRMIESIFILALNKGNLQFSFHLKNEKINNSVTRYKFDIGKQIYKFKHLQKRYKNGKPIKILTRFKEQIKFMIKTINNMLYCFLFQKSIQYFCNKLLIQKKLCQTVN